MLAGPIALIVASLQAAAPAPAETGANANALRPLHDQAIASAIELNRRLTSVDDLTASYAGDAPTLTDAARETLLREAQEESGRLSTAYVDFWSRWDSARLEQGVALIKAAASGRASAEETGRFFETSETDQFKSVVEATVARYKAAVDREAVAREAFERRKAGARANLGLAALAGAAAAGLATAAVFSARSGARS